jgi:hypothetical protein
MLLQNLTRTEEKTMQKETSEIAELARETLGSELKACSEEVELTQMGNTLRIHGEGGCAIGDVPEAIHCVEVSGNVQLAAKSAPALHAEGDAVVTVQEAGGKDTPLRISGNAEVSCERVNGPAHLSGNGKLDADRVTQELDLCGNAEAAVNEVGTSVIMCGDTRAEVVRAKDVSISGDAHLAVKGKVEGNVWGYGNGGIEVPKVDGHVFTAESAHAVVDQPTGKTSRAWGESSITVKSEQESEDEGVKL